MKRKNPAPDRRVQRTQRALREALLQLLKDYPLQKIAVTKLCEQSDLNRTTFYTYYSDPTDLFNSIVDEVIDQLETDICDSFSNNSFEVLFDKITQSIYDDRELYRILFSARSDINFMQHLSSLRHRNPFHIFREQNPDFSSEKLEYLLLFLLSGCNGIIQQWVLGEFREEPEQISAYMQSFCTGTLFGLLKEKEQTSKSICETA